jgi:hypothetical protein
VSVFNRRNAVLGWATWAAAKTVLRRRFAAKADAEAARAAEEQAAARRWWRRGARGEPPPPELEPKKKRSKGRLIGFVMATAVGIGIWLRTRRKGGGYVEPWIPPANPSAVPPVDAIDEAGGNSGPPAGEAEPPAESPDAPAENQEPVE